MLCQHQRLLGVDQLDGNRKPGAFMLLAAELLRAFDGFGQGESFRQAMRACLKEEGTPVIGPRLDIHRRLAPDFLSPWADSRGSRSMGGAKAPAHQAPAIRAVRQCR